MFPSFEQRVQQQEQKTVQAGGTMVGFQGPESLRVDSNTGKFESTPYDVESWMRGLDQQMQTSAQLDYIRKAGDQTQYGPNGLPVDWDYRTAKTGPFGQPMPPGAIGYTPYGEPYYGEGPMAWLVEKWDSYNMMRYDEGWDNYRILQETVPEQYWSGTQIRETSKKLWEDGDYGGWIKHQLGLGASLANFAIKGITYGENSPGVLKQLSWGIGTVLDGIFEVAQQPARLVERVVAPYAIAADEILTRQREATGYTQGWRDWMNSDILTVPSTISKLILAAPFMATDEYGNAVEKYKEAGIWRMGYTAQGDAMAREEFMRRLDAGEDPRLLAMELQDIGKEVVGQIVLDPLNALGKVTKAFNKARQARIATRTSSILPELAGLQDEIADAIAITNQTQKAEKLSEITNRVNDAVQAYQFKVGKGRKAIGSLEDVASMRGPRILTAEGKQAVYGVRVGNFLNEAAVHFGNNPDAFLDFVHGMAKLAGGNVDEVTEAMALMSKSGFSINRILSPGGIETSYIMRGLMLGSDGELRHLDEMIRGLDHIDDVAGYAEKVGKKLEQALAKQFPTLTEEIKRIDELAQITDEAARAKHLAKYPYAANEVSPFMRGLEATHQTMQKFIYKPSYKIMNTVYMGLNPAYRMRNRLTNSLHVMVDAGIGPGIQTLFAPPSTKGVKALFSPLKAAEEVKSYLGFIPETAMKGIGGPVASTGDGLLNFYTGKAAADEQAAGLQVYRASVRDSMRKGIKAAMADAPEALNTFSREQQDIIRRLMRDNRGNVDNVVKALMDMNGEGYSAVRNLMFLSDDDVLALERLGLYDEARRIAVEADNVDDALRQLEDLRSGHHGLADEAARETPLLHTDNLTEIEQAEHISFEALDEALDAAKVNGGDRMTDEFSRRVVADRRARDMADHVQDEVERLAVSRISGPASTLSDVERSRLQAAYLDIRATSERQVTELRNSIRVQNDTLRDSTWALDAELRARDRLTQKVNKNVIAHDPVAYEDFIKRAGLPAQSPEFYADLMKKKPYIARRQLQGMLWVGDNGYYNKMQTLWDGFRNRHVTLRQAQVQELSKIAGMNRMELAHKMDLINFENDVAKMVGKGKVLDDGTMVYELSRAQTTAILAQRKAEAIAAGMSEEAAQAYSIRSMAGRSKYRQDELRSFLSGTSPTYRVPVIGPTDVVAPSHARVAHETRAKVDEMMDKVIAGVRENFDVLHKEIGFTGEQMVQLRTWQGTMGGRMQELRASAVAVADQARNFTLLNYAERYGMDLVAGYIYPYHYWYSRTYKNWMNRLMYDPALVANYARYRGALEKINAGAPEWFKHQINVSEMLGIETDHPFYFNLEATLSPLYGLTGVDFEDPRRRMDWWSKTVEDLGKFGPSTWTPYQLALAAVYHVQGQDEAASRWAGRGVPFTLPIRDITALAGVRGGKGLELDPLVWLFSGGMTAQDRARVGRSLTALQQSGEYTDAQIMDAAYAQEGPIWDKAIALSIRNRTPNVATALSPFFLGVGFRMRTEQDVEIDRMYAEMYNLMGSRDRMPTEEYQESWSRLREKYPFMSALLLSRKAGPERDEAYAWDVLNRVPPGTAQEKIYESLGIEYDDISAFYDVSGDVTKMSDADRHTLMSAVLKLGAYLELPAQPTRAEWDEVKRLRSQARDVVEAEFGEDIYDLIDGYWAQPEDVRDEYAERHPGLNEAIARDKELKLSNPLLAAYYMPFEKIERYLKGEVWAEAERKYPNIYNMFEVYGRLKDVDPKAARAYWKKNDEFFKDYQNWRDEQYARIATELATYGLIIPDPIPAEWRQQAPEGFDQTLEDEDEAWIRAEVLAWAADAPDAVTAPDSDAALYQLIQTYGPAIGRLWSDNAPLPDVVKEILSEYNLAVEE